MKALRRMYEEAIRRSGHSWFVPANGHGISVDNSQIAGKGFFTVQLEQLKAAHAAGRI